VLTPLSSPATYVTFACVSSSSGMNGDSATNDGTSRVTYSLAGHLPILHYSAATGGVEERSVSNLPLGMFEGVQFDCGTLDCAPGDILALISDGLTEASNAAEEELGLQPLKALLSANAKRPLPEIISAMRDRALAFGKQTDDQSVLLLRRRT